MQNETFKKKIRCAAKVSIVVLAVYILLPLYVSLTNFCKGVVDGYHTAGDTEGMVFLELFTLFLQFIAVLLGILAIVNSMRLLFGIQKGETPFTLSNAIRIRKTGIMLMLIEPLMVCSKLAAGEKLYEIYGITFVAGLIMYNVSLLFDYGSHLQQESDETL